MKEPTRRTMDVIDSVFGTILFLHGFINLALGNYIISGWVFTTAAFFLISVMTRNITEEYRDIVHKCNDLLGRSLAMSDKLIKEKEDKNK